MATPTGAPGYPLVDVHSHIYLRPMIEQYKRRTEMPRIVGDIGEERFLMFPAEANEPANGRPMSSRFWDASAKLQFMDEQGISHSVVSLGNPWLSPFTSPDDVHLARQVNHELSELYDSSGQRLVPLGVVPETSVADAVAEIERLASSSNCRGIVVGSRLLGRQLDDAELHDIWRALDSAAFVVLLHPHYGLGLDEMGGYGRSISGSLGFTFETTLALVRLAFAGIFDEFRSMTLIAAHGGGTLPFLMGRIDAGWCGDAKAQRVISVPPSEYLSRIYVDSVVFHPRAVRAAVDLFGADRVMFGTDHPFRIDPSQNVDALQGLSEGDQHAVAYGNAHRLLGLVPSATPGSDTAAALVGERSP